MQPFHEGQTVKTEVVEASQISSVPRFLYVKASLKKKTQNFYL